MNREFKANFTTLLLIWALAIPFSSYGVDGQIKLTQPVAPDTFPIVINQAGSYVLTSNLVVTDPATNAITIEVNDVTLDLKGHTIQGPNAGHISSVGIYAQNRYNLTLKNGRVWGFGNGIYLYSASANLSREGAGHCVEGIQAANNEFNGIYIDAGLVTNCTANNNATAAGIEAYNSKITHCTTNNNLNGIWAANSSITNCTANHNLSGGINSDDRSHIKGNNLRNNGGYGLYLSGVDNYVIKNVASDNGGNFGIQMGSENYMPIWPAGGDNANYEFISSDLGDWCEINSHPISLSFMYTGGGCAASNNSQDSLQWDCSGSIDSLQPISVTSSNTGYQINPITVRPGEGFVVSNSGTPLTSSSNFTLTNQGGIEQLEIHTSCSQPLVQGDVFGCLTLINYTGQ